MELIEESEVYKNFITAIDSEVTKQDYRNSIGYFMKHCKVETYDSLLSLANNTRKLEGIIRDYITHLKERKLSPGTISAYTNAISRNISSRTSLTWCVIFNH